ncbi:MAG: hypothetical protein RLZZ297_915 [Chloroflexota bacterium]|jgi:hypothetical protein
MMTLGVLIAIAAGVVFLGVAFFVWNGVFDSIAATVLPRFVVMNDHLLTRIGSILYIVALASLPATLAMLTTLKIVAMVRSVWNF